MNQVIGTRLYKTSKWLIILAAVVIFGVQLLKYLLNSSCTSAGAAAATATPAPCTPAPAPAPMTAWSTSPIYVVTATYPRPQQVAELTRLAQTLMHVRDLHWLVVEDAARKTSLVADLLRRTRISFDHLVAPMPEAYKTLPRRKPRGVSNRNRGLAWIRKNATSGVVYFADDDNTYDIEVFEEMRRTRRVSMWPVGLCTDLGVSSPVVLGGKFAGFYDGWPAGRKFPVDMAGFAVSVAFLLQRPKATMPYVAGYEEDGFLQSLAPFEPHEIELKADNCSKILVWHTQTKDTSPSPPLDMATYIGTNIVQLKKLIV